MNSQHDRLLLRVLILLPSILLISLSINYYNAVKAQEASTKNICVATDETVRVNYYTYNVLSNNWICYYVIDPYCDCGAANLLSSCDSAASQLSWENARWTIHGIAKRKKCLLRPDTGPCRADILAYYYDGKQQKCYQFFYGGCQGNGNNFRTRKQCHDECFLAAGTDSFHRPYFCNLAFDYGTCFGQYNRWGWDPVFEICKQRLYSGCGGNQNNFETKVECMATCLSKPNHTMNAPHLQLTTCIPFTLPEFN